jgi:inward rectifier potassium channel
MSIRRVIRQDESREFGFGNRVVSGEQRLMNRDGSSNVRRKGLGYFERFNVFHELIRMPWWKFFTILFSTYLVINLFFASCYYFTRPDNISGMIYHNEAEKFMEIFFFSAQSLTTVGYGRLNPTGMFDSALASIEAMVGLLGFAIATGLLYGRFSRPVVKLLYSDKALVAPYRDLSALMLRVAKKHRSELVDIQASVILSYVMEENGKPVRKFANLKLEFTRVNLLTTSWTIVHPIDDESPLTGWSADDFVNRRAEVLVLLQAFEETFANNVHSRTSYKANEIVVGAKFRPVQEAGEEGSVVIHLDRISDIEPAPLPAQAISPA